MVERIRAHPALKHGGYSGMSLLPGENPAEFEKFRRELIAEYAPVGRSEENEVAKLAHYMWRRMHLGAYQRAEQMRRRRDEIFLSLCPREAYATRINGLTAAEKRELMKDADEQARNELGQASSWSNSAM